MKKILNLLKSFFFPPPGTPISRRILPYAVLGVLTLVVGITGVYSWEYTNSSVFCGTTCHTMPPEYATYLLSPHARVDCVECHIGRDFIATRISRKAGDLRHIFALMFKTYEFPIRAGKLRPARDTCETCHSPEKFSDDSLREIIHYADDIYNTPYTIYLVMKTGGGSERQGLGRGIHWHIENEVYYMATDADEQDIPYVRVVNADGSVTDYVDLRDDFDTSTVDISELKLMDCITCHNRITHLILRPEESVESLMSRGLISTSIPEIRKQAVKVMKATYETIEEALVGIEGLDAFYADRYPDFYARDRFLISEAIDALQDVYVKSVFPDQKEDWYTYPDNIGHEFSPGCFRCHDGKHLNNLGEAIRLECNLCHSIPVVVGPGELVANVEISRGIEPSTHLNTNWINLHRETFDATCENCHTIGNPGGVTNDSFCSNSACHGTAWVFAGFDAPGLREVLAPQLPPTPTPVAGLLNGPLTYNGVIGVLFNAHCTACHGTDGVQNLDFTTYESMLAGGVSGPAVIPGNPEDSLLVRVQSGRSAHFGQFTPEELEAVIEWINNGAPED